MIDIQLECTMLIVGEIVPEKYMRTVYVQLNSAVILNYSNRVRLKNNKEKFSSAYP